jgi:hypothetical protein
MNDIEDDYVTIKEVVVDVLGFKVKAVTERFSDHYLHSKRYQSRCLRCVFKYNRQPYDEQEGICHYLNCWRYGDEAMHFEFNK